MKARTPLLVGLVLVAAIAGITWFFMATNKDAFDDDSTYPLHADFQDASGIRGKTRVQINGIDVGKIVSIEHVRGANGKLVARVNMRILDKYEIYDDAEVRKAAESLLGDFRLDLDPGTPEGHKKIAPDGAIVHVNSLSDIDEIKDQLLHVTRNVNDVTQSFSKVLAGPEGEGSLKAILNKVENSMGAIEQTTRALENTVTSNNKAVGEIIRNVRAVTEGLAMVTQPGGDVRTITHNLAELSAKLGRVADNVNMLIAGQDVATSDADRQSGNLRNTLDNLNETMAHLNDVARKVDQGQGTLGRIVNDSGIADRVETTLDSANEIIGGIAGIETQVELRSSYDVPFNGPTSLIQPAIKNILGLRIMPKPDKFYILEAVADPRGRQTRTLTTTQVNTSTIITDETVISFNDLKFSAQFAKRYYFATLRFGITENTGGLGCDMHAIDDHLEVRLDAFDFGRRDPKNVQPIFPRLRITGIYELVNHVNIQAGFDDPFNDGLRTWFLGGVLRFTDEDLKAMLAIAPRP